MVKNREYDNTNESAEKEVELKEKQIVIEREIDLGLLNEKLNFIISLLSK